MSDWVYVTSADKLKAGEHFGIIESSSIYVPGDERSRTNPGHGYPGGSEAVITLKVTDNEAVWKEEIGQLTTARYNYRSFKAVKITVAEVNISVDVKVTT